MGMEVPPPHVVLTLTSERTVVYHLELIHIRAPCLSFYSQLLQECLANEDSRCSCAFPGTGRNEPVDIILLYFVGAGQLLPGVFNLVSVLLVWFSG